VASHCGHGGIRRRSRRPGSPVGKVTRSGPLRIDSSSRGGTSSRSVSTSPPPSPGGGVANCLPSTERTSRRISGTENSSLQARRGPVCTSSARFHTDAVPVRSSVSCRAFPDTRREGAPAPVDRGMYSRLTRFVAQAAEELERSRNSRSAFSQSSTSCPSSRPRSQYSSNARRAMSLSVPPDAIAAAVGDSSDGIGSTLSVCRLADLGIMHLSGRKVHACRRHRRRVLAVASAASGDGEDPLVRIRVEKPENHEHTLCRAPDLSRF
jgi:hypothetical protein